MPPVEVGSVEYLTEQPMEELPLEEVLPVDSLMEQPMESCPWRRNCQ